MAKQNFRDVTIQIISEKTCTYNNTRIMGLKQHAHTHTDREVHINVEVNIKCKCIRKYIN